jgi:hypothetical protein
VDLHKVSQTRKLLYADVDAAMLQRTDIMTALQSGRFTFHGGNIAIPSSGDLTFLQELSIAVKQPLCRPAAG